MDVSTSGLTVSCDSVVGRVLARPLPSGAEAQLLVIERRLETRDSGLYLSTPITTGERWIQWRQGRGAQLDEQDSSFALTLRREVIDENIRRVAPLRDRIATKFPGEALIDPTVLEMSTWSQMDYHRFWLEVLGRYVGTMVMADGWEYSTGCTLEFAFAHAKGIPCLNADLDRLAATTSSCLLTQAADRLESAHLPSDIQRNVVADIADDPSPR